MQIFEVPSRNRSNFTEVSPLEKSATSTSGQMETTTSTSSNSSLTTPNNTISTSSSNSSPFTSEAPQNKEPKQERVRVAEKCAVCSYPLQPEWKFCPMCATVIPKDEVLNIYAHVDTSGFFFCCSFFSEEQTLKVKTLILTTILCTVMVID
jgi:hypothetical protein